MSGLRKRGLGKMGEISQNDLEYLTDMVRSGKMTAAQANVYKVRCMRIFVVRGRIPAEVRLALNTAVKTASLSI
jgi:hypothetical protein